MKRGSKPQPTALKLVKGNPGKRALPKNEPKPPPLDVVPEPPAFLMLAAKDEWHRMGQRLVDIGLLTDIDTGVFAAYCQAWARWDRLERDLEVLAARDPATHGVIIRTTNGNMVQNPLIGAASTAMQLVHKFAVELGMTPSARSRLDVDVGHARPPQGGKGGPAAPTGTDRFFG